jgi:hypothetical protein
MRSCTACALFRLLPLRHACARGPSISETYQAAELKSVTIAGDFRRGTELVRDLVIVAEAPSIEGSPADLKFGDLTVHLTDPKRLGITLLRATGNTDHFAQLEELARGRGYALTAFEPQWQPPCGFRSCVGTALRNSGVLVELESTKPLRFPRSSRSP